MTGRVIVGLLWVTILIVLAGRWQGAQARHDIRAFAPSSTTATAVLDDLTYSQGSGRDAASPPRFDLYGNEIEDAVGDYRIDVRGHIYERHSPDTEVTRLGSPSL